MRDIGVTKHVATLGAASVILGETGANQKLDIDLNEFLGKERIAAWQGARATEARGCMSLCGAVLPWRLKHCLLRSGFRRKDRELIDVDLKSAYTTALALIQIPDWNSARISLRCGNREAMTFAHVNFRRTKLSLPVRASAEARCTRRSWCTGPEIVTALMMPRLIIKRLAHRWQEGEAIRWGFPAHQ